eukprot:scpid110247/ scgid11197/ 
MKYGVATLLANDLHAVWAVQVIFAWVCYCHCAAVSYALNSACSHCCSGCQVIRLYASISTQMDKGHAQQAHDCSKSGSQNLRMLLAVRCSTTVLSVDGP